MALLTKLEIKFRDPSSFQGCVVHRIFPSDYQHNEPTNPYTHCPHLHYGLDVLVDRPDTLVCARNPPHIKSLALLPCVLLAALELLWESPRVMADSGPSKTGAGMTGAEFLKYKVRRMITK